MERLTDFDRRKNIEEACNIWNKLKDKTKIVDVIINLKNEITKLEKENVELKEVYELCNNLRKLEVEKNRNYHTEKYNLDKPVEELRKIKIPAEMKDYYYKGFDNAERQFASHIADLTMKIEVLEEELRNVTSLEVPNNEIDYSKRKAWEQAKKELE